jgi:uncharacterized protein DUF5107/uncharacterized protein
LGDNAVVCTEFQDDVLTHELTPAGPVPTAFDPNGVYPYVSYVATAPRPILKTYRFIALENDRLRVVICPDLGGKVVSIVHKGSGREVLYTPGVIKPVRILPRFAFVPGGIAVSFPISHSPTQNERVLARIDRTSSRVYVTCGERELRFGMHWSVEYSLGAGDDFLTQRAVFHNPGHAAYPWMSWSNAALRSAPDTEFHFPDGEVLSHSASLESIDWRRSGPRRESDIAEMTGFFWKRKAVNAFGAFTPSLGSGLYHVADVAVAPGMKLWSYGVGDDRAWATLGAAHRQPYVEIQGGPLADQATKVMLEPNETRSHVEFWIPSDKALDISALHVPDASLRPTGDVPRFDWARESDVEVWKDLVIAYETKARLPAPPEVRECRWAPSGMEDLGAPFEFAIEKARDEPADRWRFHYGTWLAGRGDKDAAVGVLTTSTVGVARALLARLLKADDDYEGAARAFGSIREKWVQLHPQIIVERDDVLRRVGPEALAERERWLDEADPVEDERVVERRVQLLIDKGEFRRAKELLLSVPFQRIHQRYVRSMLWNALCEKLNEPCAPIPTGLGEDRLATFGAYREFE